MEHEDIIKRVKMFSECKSDAALARWLDMSPQKFLAQKKAGTIKNSLFSRAVEKGANPEWVRTGEGPVKAINSAAGSGSDEIAELRKEIMRLQGYIIDLGGEIGRIKDRMLDAAQSGDIGRLGAVGGKGG